LVKVNSRKDDATWPFAFIAADNADFRSREKSGPLADAATFAATRH
jgi:hypothetical protein